MLSQRDADKLVADIRRLNITSWALAQRSGDPHAADSFFRGGIEIALQHFLRAQGCMDAAAALPAAMNEAPSAEQIAARNAELDRMRRAA